MTATYLKSSAGMLAVACFSMMALPAATATAQMINVQTPLQTNRDSYFERNGVGFGLNFPGNSRIRGLSPTGQLLPNVFLSQGSFGETVPGFGGYTPNSPLRFGFATIGGNVNTSFGLEMGKGFRRSSVTQAPSVTMMNGQSASIFSGSLVPFVTRIDPVIGGGGNHLRSSLLRSPGSPSDSYSSYTSSQPRTYSNNNSTAMRGDISVADIHKQKRAAAAQANQALQQELDELLSVAESLVAEGNYAAARAKYGRALRKVREHEDMAELRQQLEKTLSDLRNKR